RGLPRAGITALKGGSEVRAKSGALAEAGLARPVAGRVGDAAVAARQVVAWGQGLGVVGGGGRSEFGGRTTVVRSWGGRGVLAHPWPSSKTTPPTPRSLSAETHKAVRMTGRPL